MRTTSLENESFADFRSMAFLFCIAIAAGMAATEFSNSPLIVVLSLAGVIALTLPFSTFSFRAGVSANRRNIG